MNKNFDGDRHTGGQGAQERTPTLSYADALTHFESLKQETRNIMELGGEERRAVMERLQNEMHESVKQIFIAVFLHLAEGQEGTFASGESLGRIATQAAAESRPIFGEESSGDQISHAIDALDMAILASETDPKLGLMLLMHDIGKAGPDAKNSDTTNIFSAMFAYNFPYADFIAKRDGIDPAEVKPWQRTTGVSVAEFIGRMVEHPDNPSYATQKDMLATLESIGIDRTMTMREFYNSHISMGVALYEKEQFVPPNIAWAALAHHILFQQELVPKISGYTATVDDVRYAAAIQALDYCNAAASRRDPPIPLEQAAEEACKKLSDAIDKGAYQHPNFPVEISSADADTVKQYLQKVVSDYVGQVKGAYEQAA